MSVSVISIDPAPSKTSTVCRGTAFEHGKYFCETTPENLRHLLKGVEPNTLVCWDAPLTGPRDPTDRAGQWDRDFSQRPIERFFARQETGFKAPSGISVLPYSGCPHWAITRSLLGLPRTGPYDTGYDDLPFRLLPGQERDGNPRPSIVEIHPAVAAWLWCRGSDGFPQDTEQWPYKKDRALREQIWRLICRKTRVATCPDPLANGDDDEFDAAVGYRLGVLYLQDRHKPVSRRRVILLGDRETGSFLVPKADGLSKSWDEFVKK